jgi:hypothetical protein
MSMLESRPQFTFPPNSNNNENHDRANDAELGEEAEEEEEAASLSTANGGGGSGLYSSRSSVRSTVLMDTSTVNTETTSKHSVSSSINKTPGTPRTASIQLLTIDHLVQSEILHISQVEHAQKATEQVIQLIIYYNIMHRLHGSMNDFFATLSDKSRLEPHKFPTYFHHSIDFYNSIVNQNYPTPVPAFGCYLKSGHQSLLNSFITLIKSSPTFIASSLLSMSFPELNNFTCHSLDPFEDLSSLYRSNPLDILFYGFFPPEVPQMQRLEYFSQICAVLMDSKKGEKVCFEVFDKVMAISGHPFKSSLEILILDLLQDGSFLTLPSLMSSSSKKRSPSACSSNVPSPELSSATLATSAGEHPKHPGAPGSINTNSSSSLSSLYRSSEERTAEFHHRAIIKILGFLDNLSAESLPQSFLTFSRLVLAKVSRRNHQHCLLLIVVKYLFNRHLCKLITGPENFGILKTCFINDIQRQRILIPVFQKAYRLVASVLLEENVSDMDIDVKYHIDSIVDKFCAPPPDSVPSSFDLDSKFGPMANFTQTDYYSPGQLLVLAPSDVVKLYSALFPSFASAQRSAPSSATSSTFTHHKPVTMEQRQSYNFQAPFPLDTGYSTTATSFVSTQSSLSDNNLPSLAELVNQVNNQYNEDVAVMDDDDDCDGMSPMDSPKFSESYEWSLDDIRTDLEPVMDDLVKKFPYLQLKSSSYFSSLRPSKLNNFKIPHPMNECWQVFMVNEKGEVDILSATSILDYAKATKGTSMLNNDDNSDDISSPIAPANRGLAGVVKKAIERLISTSANYHYEYADCVQPSSAVHPSGYAYSLLSNAMDRAVAKENFLEANEYTNALNALKKLLPHPNSQTYSQVAVSVNNHIMSLISKEKDQGIAKVNHQVEVAEDYSLPYKIHLRNATKRCKEVFVNLHDTRTKVWYVTEIRPSPLWNRAKDVARALTQGSSQSDSLAESQSTPTSPFPTLKRNNSTSSLSSSGVFSFKRFTSGSHKRDYSNRRQSLMNSLVPQTDGMFAAKEYAGEYKLSDREAESTRKWLRGQKVQNFCTGEERIHRFCCEVDDLIKRIMGDVLSSRRNRGHSLLSSSGLFKTDLWKLILEVEGIDRSSTPSLQRSSTSHHPQHGPKSEFEYQFGRPADLTSERRDSYRPGLDRTGSLKASHRSQRSSPNLLDMFSSFDVTSSRRGSGDISPHDSGFESSSSFHKPNMSSTSSHRRNKSLNDTKSGSDDIAKDDLDTYLNTSPGYPQDGSSNMDAKRQELDSVILDLQMRLTGMIYSDIGMGCWFEGEYFFVISSCIGFLLFPEKEAKSVCSARLRRPLATHTSAKPTQGVWGACPPQKTNLVVLFFLKKEPKTLALRGYNGF